MADKQISDLTAASALDGTELVHIVQGGNSRKATVSAMNLFKGFRATTSTTQAVGPATLTEMDFGSEVFDTESAFASNRFTVPATLNGAYMNFIAGVRTAAVEVLSLNISKSTDGGTNFTRVASNTSDNSQNCTISTGPVQVATGEIFRVEIFTADASTVSDEDRTFFAGHRV